MAVNVPSWVVGLVGGMLVVASVLMNPACIEVLAESVNAERAEISQLTESYQRLWSSHTLAEQRAASANMLGGLIAQSQPGPPHQFLLDGTDYHMVGAIDTMWDATGEMERDPVFDACVAELRQRLRDGDVSAYKPMSVMLGRLRSSSRDAMNERAKERRESEIRLQALETRLDSTRRWQATLNIIGLLLVLFKDLPIWRRVN